MEKSMVQEIIKYIIVLFIIRGILIYFTKDSFFDTGFIGLIIGCIIGRIIFLKKNR